MHKSPAKRKLDSDESSCKPVDETFKYSQSMHGNYTFNPTVEYIYF